MAFALVNPINALWQRRGLSCLLMPEGFDAFAVRQAAELRTPPASQAQARPSGAPHSAPAHAPARADANQAAHSTKYRANDGERPAQENGHSWRRPQQGQQQAGPAAEPPARTAPENAPTKPADAQFPAGSGLWRPLPPHVWPSPWRVRLEQTRPGIVLWTYWNLGPDLCDAQAQGRMDRRGFLQRLLQDLGHPAGTHTFWPACLPPDPDALPDPHGAPQSAQDNGYVGNPDVFWSGAHSLKARGVVVMGSAAATAVGLPGGLRPPQQIRHRGHLVWVLWDVDNLLRFDQRYASMLAFLRQAMISVLR